MKRYHTHSDSKTKATFQNLIKFRSKSKEAINQMKDVYQKNRHIEMGKPAVVGVRIRNPSPSPNKASNNLKIKIPVKSRTPNSKSPACLTRREEPRNVQPQIMSTRPLQKIQEFKKKTHDHRYNFKLNNNTQKFFRKEREKPVKVQNNLSQTLKMVWEHRPAKQKHIQFRMLKSIAKSQAGQIIQAASNITGLVAAIKTFKKKQLNLQFLIDQIKIHMFCDHPNILSAYGYHIGKDEVYLVMEVGECNLYDQLIRFAPLEESVVADYIAQVASGVAYLHSLGVMHRDIKPQNIILLGGCLKLADFGWSIRTNKLRKTLCGTLDYLSPEVSNRQYYNNKIDCWSIGVLMYELLVGQPPFPDQKEQTCTFQHLKLPKKISPGAKNLLLQLLEVDPIDRISAREILNHDWIKKYKILKQTTQKFQFKELANDLSKIFS